LTKSEGSDTDKNTEISTKEKSRLKRRTLDTTVSEKHIEMPLKLLSLGAGVIVLMTLFVYIPAMRGGFVWDDDSYVTKNSMLTSVEGLGRIWSDPTSCPQYYPLVFSSFWIERQLWGLRPAGYHVVNVLLHSFCAVLLWILLRRLEVPGAWLAAMVFALHPVQVESVAWITERKNVLSTLFYLASWLCLFHFFRMSSKEGSKDCVECRQWQWYMLGLLLFVCALLSKTTASSLPAAVLLVLWWKRGSVRWRHFTALLPFFALGLGLGLCTLWLERHHVGAQGLEWELSLLERCLIAGRALWFYACNLAWPAELMFNYPRWEVDAGVWWQYAYLLGVLLVVWFLWAFRARLGRGLLAGTLFFCGTLFPALGFFDAYPFRYSFVADHFQYMASIGLIALAVGVLTHVTLKLPVWPRRAGAVLALLFVVLLGVRTWHQGSIYVDLETLWVETLKKNPASWLAHNNLGNILAEQGRIKEASAHYSKALRMKPDHAETHNNLGLALFRQGRIDEALRHYYRAVQIMPHSAQAHNNLAVALNGEGRLDEATSHYFEALGRVKSETLRVKPHFIANVNYNIGTALEQQGRLSEAIDHFSAALRIEPNFVGAHNNLGIALSRQGKLDEAISYFSEALRIKPDDAAARRNLKRALRLAGKEGSHQQVEAYEEPGKEE